MIVERVWTGNAYRNYNYLIACPESGEALAIDPLDHHGKCLAEGEGERLAASPRSSTPMSITTTPVATPRWWRRPAPRSSPTTGAGARIDGVDRGVAGRRRDQGRQDRRARMPGHARPHDVPHLPALAHRQPALFSGDTLFNAGAGNCHNGGNARAALYETFVDQLAKLPADTRVYPGHDYIENNLRFTLAREPDNAAAERADWPAVSRPGPGALGRVTTHRRRKRRFNTFLRLSEPGRHRRHCA